MQLSFVAGEIRNPQRNALFALAFGSLACIAIYLLANMAYLRVLSIPEIAASEHASAQRLLNYNSLFVSVFLSRHLLCLAEYAT